MKLIEIANAGTLESSDIQIIIEPNENGGIVIELESVVKAQFGEQVEDVITNTLKELGEHGKCSMPEYDEYNEQIRLKLNFNKETYEDTTLTIENLTENKYEYGEEYILEAFYNNEWHKINWNEEPFFNLVLRIINPKEIVINKINNNLLKSLEKGKYRIVKVFNNEESKSDNIKVYSSTEFEIK